MQNINSVWEASHNISEFARATPVVSSEFLSRSVGFELFLKAENLQATNSFKVRGAANFLVQLKKHSANVPGVVAASSGNHGQAVAYVASKMGLPAIIVMPETAPRVKIDAVSRWGAEVEFCGKTSPERLARAKEINLAKGYVEIPPYDHADIMAGQGTVGKEILEQIPDADIILVPIGGGGLISGIALAVKSLRPETMVIGVEPENSNSMYVSFNKGEITQLDKAESIADGLLTLRPGNLTFPLVKKYVDDIMLVKESAIMRAMKACLDYFKIVPEPSGAVSLAAALEGNMFKGKKIVSVISGGNLDLAKLSVYLK